MPSTHYRERVISDISPKDSNVSVVGRVFDVKEGFFILEDETGRIKIHSDLFVSKNKLLRVYCTIADGSLTADIVQDLEGFDLDLFKKIKSLYNSTGV